MFSTGETTVRELGLMSEPLVISFRMIESILERKRTFGLSFWKDKSLKKYSVPTRRENRSFWILIG